MGFIDNTQFKDNFQYFDKEIVLEIIDIFINEYPERIKSIADSISEKDFDKIKFNSHSIKGVIANFVAPDVQQLAKELEMKGTNKDLDGINELFESFKASSSAMLEELKNLREEYK